MRALRACTTGILLALAGAACGDDGDDSGRIRSVTANPQSPTFEDEGDGGPGDGVGFIPRPGSVGGEAPAKAPISELDAEGVAALCEELDARFAARIDGEQANVFACTLLGLSEAIDVDADGLAAIDASACAVSVERCMAAPAGSQATVDCATLERGARGCKASLSELQACFDAEILRVAAMLDVLSCSLTTVADLDAVLVGLLASGLTECEVVVSECPALLPSIGLGSSSLPAFDGCSDSCESALDGICDDGGDEAMSATCVIGSDCNDCGPR
jgi:hypothetical protein